MSATSFARLSLALEKIARGVRVLARSVILLGSVHVFGLWTTAAADVDVAADRAAFRAFYQQRFPDLPLDKYVLGVYAIDANLRAQYDAIVEFPPYEFVVGDGIELLDEALDVDADLRSCIDRWGRGPHQYPFYDNDSGEIVTLPVVINQCRVRNGLKPLSYRRGDLAKILAALSYENRDKRRAIEAPLRAAALDVYRDGRAFFYAKRGQLNLSCADCHMQAVGRHLREQTLAPLLGTVNHYPVYGLSWGGLGTLHQRFVGCLEQVRAVSPAPQSPAFRALEYFLALMSNDLPMTGPGIHR